MWRWNRAVVGASLALLMVGASATPGMAAAYPKPLPQQWWFTAWDIQNKVWPLSQGNGVTVAVLDTGVEASIPDLAGVVLPGIDAGNGGSDGRTDLDDAAVPGHGTGMASLIAAQARRTGFLGVAPQVKILPVITKTRSTTAPGIRYAVDHGAKVINISQASPMPCQPDVQEAVGYALQHDVLVVAGAGNSGDTSNESMTPANCAGVLAVGAVNGQMVPWSKSERQPYVTVAAPGVGVSSVLKDGQLHTSNGGTSGATALTSGAAALVRAKYPTMSAREVVQRLIASTRDAGPKGKDDQTGYGVVRPYHALADNVPKSAPNPVFDAYDKWAAANGGAGASNSSGKSVTDDGPNWGRIAMLVVGLIIVIAIIVATIVTLLRRGRSQPAAGPSYPPQGPPSFGGQPYGPAQPPAPGARPQFYPPAGQAPEGTSPQPGGHGES
jgi:type VII secretion-associated serine protease mycosin